MDYIDDLINIVRHTAAQLRTVSDPDAARRPAPGKWSAKEVVGHLIDSASNNQQRFVRAQGQGDLVFPGYEQDQWVAAQNYQSAPWSELIDLWLNYNLHLARVMRAVPDTIRNEPRVQHNLDDIAWKTIPRTEPVTLDYFMKDYVAHLKHHVEQIRALVLADA